MAVHGIEHGPGETHSTHIVSHMEYSIQTTVTDMPAVVDSWISDIEHMHRLRLHSLVVGLDVEWRPNRSSYHENPVATLQLCVGRRCLIFQLIYAPSIPDSLFYFLENPNYTFVGVGIDADVDKLTKDYELGVANTVDLRHLAARERMNNELLNAGLRRLALEILGWEMEKPRRITMSRWDNKWLTDNQIKYACLDAFLSFEIGRLLGAWGS